MRIAISSSPFRRAFALRELTQLEWLERCASVLAVDGVLPELGDFPRSDGEYVAQLRKVAIDLGLVPLGIDAPALLEEGASIEEALAVATAFGGALLRTRLPAPGEVPPATFVETVGRAKAASKAAKGVNITALVAAAPGTLAEDLPGLKHLLKDVDSAWLRAVPRALDAIEDVGAKERYPALLATPADDPREVAGAASRTWLILDAQENERPWDLLEDAIAALRNAEAERRLIRR
jgi:hypothetical protein